MGADSTLGELAQVDQTDDAAVTVDRCAGDEGDPAEEGPEVLDDQLGLALQPVDGPGDLASRAGAVAYHEGGFRRFAGPRQPEGGTEVEQWHGHAVPDDDRRPGEGVHLGVAKRK